MAAIQRVIVYVGLSFVAVASLMAGFEALASHPIAGVLLMLAGMALSLYGMAGLFEVPLRRERDNTRDAE